MSSWSPAPCFGGPRTSTVQERCLAMSCLEAAAAPPALHVLHPSCSVSPPSPLVPTHSVTVHTSAAVVCHLTPHGAPLLSGLCPSPMSAGVQHGHPPTPGLAAWGDAALQTGAGAGSNPVAVAPVWVPAIVAANCSRWRLPGGACFDFRAPPPCGDTGLRVAFGCTDCSLVRSR